MNVGTVEAVLLLRDQFTSQIKRVVGDLEKKAKKIEMVGRDIVDVGQRFSLSIGAPVGAAGVAVVKLASDFETAFTGVRKTVDGTEAELQVLAQGIRDLAKEIPVGTTELAKIAEMAGQLGVSKSGILEFTETIAGLTRTTNLMAESAAVDLARIASVTGLAESQFSSLGSAIVDLGNKYETQEDEIVTYGKYLAGVGTTAGLTAAQILAVGTAASAAGIQAEAGGTAIQKVLISMTEAAVVGGPKLQLFASTAGMAAKDFADLWSKDAAQAFTMFVEGLNREGTRAYQILDDLELRDERLTRTFIALAQSGDKLRSALNDSTTAFDANLALTTEAEKRYATFASQLQILVNNIKDVAIEAGTALLPILKDMFNNVIKPGIKVLGELATWFSTLPTFIQTTAMVLVALVAAIGPVLYVVGQMVAGFGALVGLLGGGAAAGGAAAGGAAAGGLAGALTGVITFLTGPAGLIAAGAGLLLAWKPTRDLLFDLGSTVLSLVGEEFSTVVGHIRHLWAESEEARGTISAFVAVVGIDLKDALRLAIDGTVHYIELAIELTVYVSKLLWTFVQWRDAINQAAFDLITLKNANLGAVESLLEMDGVLRFLPFGAAIIQIREWVKEAKELQKIRDNMFDPKKVSSDDVVGDISGALNELSAEWDKQEKQAAKRQLYIDKLTEAELKLKEAIDEMRTSVALSAKVLQSAAKLQKEAFDTDLLAEMVEVAEELGVALEHGAVKGLAESRLKVKELREEVERTTKMRTELDSIAKSTERMATAVAELMAGALDPALVAEMVKVAEEFGVTLDNEFVKRIAEARLQLQGFNKQFSDLLNFEARPITVSQDEIEALIPDAGDLFDIPDFSETVKIEADKARKYIAELQKDISDEWQEGLDSLADGIGAAVGDAFAEMVYTGEFEFGKLLKNMLSMFVEFLADQLALYVANQLKMAAASYVANASGGGGGVSAGSVVNSGGGMSGMTATTMGIVAVFAAAAYAWYNDRQHDYTRMESAIRDVEDVFESLSDTLGEYLPALFSGVDARKDGDRFRARVGTDDGGAGYAYFDEYADAIGAAVLSSLREQLNQTDRWFDGTLAHLGEEARKVIGSITDEIINMGQAGVEWLNEGLQLARQLDELGMSDMERTLSELRRQYEENIRKGAEYGLSLQKIGDLYRSQLADVEESLRSRIAQYLPGYDPIGDEFDQIRADNDALRAEYERQREQLNEHIRQTLQTIDRLSQGVGGGAAGGANSPFNQIMDAYQRALMQLQSGGGLGMGEAIIGILSEIQALENAAVAGGGIGPEAAARIAEQRERLAELMRQLGLLGQGLTDEEINAAEREARRRQNQGSRSNERNQLIDIMDERDWQMQIDGLTGLSRALAELEHQREREMEMAHGNAELIARLNEQYAQMQADLRAENAADVRDQFRDFMGIGDSPINDLVERFTALRTEIENAGFTAERTTTMVGRLTQEYERQLAALVAQERANAVSGVQGWINQANGVGGAEGNLQQVLKQFADARQALIDLAADMRAAGQSTDWLAGDIEQLERAQRAATRSLTIDFIGSLKSLGVNIPTDKLREFAYAQWQLAKAEAISAAMALAAAGGFDNLSITLADVLGWIAEADFDLSDLGSGFVDLGGAVRDTSSAVNEAVNEMLRGKELLKDFYDSLLTGPNSPLTIMDQYQVAQADYNRLLAAVQGGDWSQAQALRDAAQRLLELGGQVFDTSTMGYQDLFQTVMNAIGGLIGEGPYTLPGEDIQNQILAASSGTRASVDMVGDRITRSADSRDERLDELINAMRENRSGSEDRLDEIIDIGRRQIDRLEEINTTTITVGGRG